MTRRELTRLMCRNDLALSVALVVLGVGGIVFGMPLLVSDFPPDSKWDAIWIGVTGLFTVVLAISTIMLWRETKAAGDRSEAIIHTSERHLAQALHVELADRVARCCIDAEHPWGSAGKVKEWANGKI